MKCSCRDTVIQVDDGRHLPAIFGGEASRDKCCTVNDFRINNFIQSPKHAERNRNAVDIIREFSVLSPNMNFTCGRPCSPGEVLLNQGCHLICRRRVIGFRLEGLIAGHHVDIRNAKFTLADHFNTLNLTPRLAGG